MTKYDFETIIDRRGTGCLKWDAWSRRGHAPDDLPHWVADMDYVLVLDGGRVAWQGAPSEMAAANLLVLEGGALR